LQLGKPCRFDRAIVELIDSDDRIMFIISRMLRVLSYLTIGVIRRHLSETTDCAGPALSVRDIDILIWFPRD
jgi:hypothetical protein